MLTERQKLIAHIESKKEFVCIADATIHGITTNEDVKDFFPGNSNQAMALAIVRHSAFYSAKKVVLPHDIYCILLTNSNCVNIPIEGHGMYLYDISQDLKTYVEMDEDAPSIKFYA